VSCASFDHDVILCVVCYLFVVLLYNHCHRVKTYLQLINITLHYITLQIIATSTKRKEGVNITAYTSASPATHHHYVAMQLMVKSPSSEILNP
jgi:hypothetical protein